MASIDASFPEKDEEKRKDGRFINRCCNSRNQIDYSIYSQDSGYIQGADLEALAKMSLKKGLEIHLNFSFGDFVVSNFPIIGVVDKKNGGEVNDKIISCLDYAEGESTKEHYVNGFTQLMEIAVKSLSPGINDPGTARLCIHQITELLAQRLQITPCNMIVDSENECLVSWHEEGFDSLMFRLFNPILHYGKDDLSICLSLLKAFKTLSNFASCEDRLVIQQHAERIVDVISVNYTDPLEVKFAEARLNVGVHRLDLPKNLSKEAASS
ncbi:DUF2254 domain-containing protein [Billgrantia pellis]|uniref:DUF2254 domain-containing protein n=1 Tax=Billgrantia pellis TaxID=2606936 RepID=A0A7V7KI17_9GAMM|nr:DUF2254 family protein [Halomonas pellis]KAA0011966.1 DUF2254 domain-containing protein [Halomonas pellis]